MEITIRRIAISEAPVLSKICKETFYDTFVDTCSKEDMDGFLVQYYDEKVIERELSDPNDLYFFAEVDQKPVAYLRFKENYETFPEIKKWKALELCRLYVQKEFHGKGIAQKLMDFYIDYAMQHKFEAIWLGVWDQNYRAQKFYGKYGFVDSGYKHDFPIGNTPQTDCWFWKFL